jgi:hypothetical protein
MNPVTREIIQGLELVLGFGLGALAVLILWNLVVEQLARWRDALRFRWEQWRRKRGGR